MTYPSVRALLGMSLCAAAAFAHYTWIAPPSTPLEPGKTAVVTIGHGHKFPASEQAVNQQGMELYVLAPSGKKVQLRPEIVGAEVAAPFAVKESGRHRILLVQDHGIVSRTPSGVQPGGRDVHKDAAQVYKSYRTAIAYAGAGGTPSVDSKAAGLEFEMTGTRSGRAWTIQVLRRGRPAANAPVEVFLNGAAEAVPAGTTGADGKLTYEPPPGAKGPAVFAATLREPAPNGANYDYATYSTSLYVSW